MKLCRYDDDKLGVVIGDMVHDVTQAQTEIRNSTPYTAKVDPVVAALPKWREYDTDFIYTFAKDSVVPGMRVRYRYGRVYEDFGTRTDRTSDTRIDLNWAVSFN